MLARPRCLLWGDLGLVASFSRCIACLCDGDSKRIESVDSEPWLSAFRVHVAADEHNCEVASHTDRHGGPSMLHGTMYHPPKTHLASSPADENTWGGGAGRLNSRIGLFEDQPLFKGDCTVGKAATLGMPSPSTP